ncbi:MAG: phosphatase PAP2 family protein [Acetatifactor sp.]|nr:phosphatase PAP2 family protein [Acetatifactor sp.]
MKKRLVPAEMILPLLITVVVNFSSYFGSRIFTTSLTHHEITFAWENKIPLWSWTIVIYWGCYLFWIVNYIIAARRDRAIAYRFFCAEVCAKLICLFFFIVYPTTNVRPVIEGTGIFDKWMLALYHVDAADNLFPSIHCLVSWFCVIAVRDNEKIPKWYRWFSLITTIAICLSTLTTKQHAFVDVVGGIGFAELCYFVVHKTGLVRRYERRLTAIGGFFGKRISKKA